MPERERGETGIPNTIKRSDKPAQEIWKKAHDSAVETYGEGARAHRMAYAALKHEYRKQGDHWVRKEQRGPSDPQAARGLTTSPKSTDEPPAPARGDEAALAGQGSRLKKARVEEQLPAEGAALAPQSCLPMASRERSRRPLMVLIRSPLNILPTSS